MAAEGAWAGARRGDRWWPAETGLAVAAGLPGGRGAGHGRARAAVAAPVVSLLAIVLAPPALDQVDLDTLTGELLAVVDQTMQPSQASLWLRSSVGEPAGRR
jgi:hypothetical protein